MLRTFLSKHASRKDREEAVRTMVAAMNSLDYSVIPSVLAADAVVIDACGHKMEGIEEIIEIDREFREQAGGPQVVIDTLDHTREEVLVRGHLASDLSEIAGPIMWRAEFDEKLIKRLEVTRPSDLMSAPMFAAHRRQRAVS